MRIRFMVIAFLLAFATSAYAEAKNPDLHITPAGEVHLVGVELWQKHATNLYSVRAWGMKWIMEIPYGMRLFSKYNAVVSSEEFKQGDILEIKGRVVTKNGLDYSIEPSEIRNLSVETGIPSSPPLPNPAPTQKPIATAAPVAEEKQKGLYMSLKKGFRGGQVSLLQKFLKDQGYIAIDSVSGYFGNETEQALKKFQKASALEAAGTVGPKTRSLINSLLK